MDIGPIIAALRRNVAGTALIVLQIALTLAIVSNALFVIEQSTVHAARPSGVVEDNLLAIQNIWIGPREDVIRAAMQADLDTLRHLPGVVHATASNTFPLRNGGWSVGVRLQPGSDRWTVQTGLYSADEDTIATLGTRLVAGRNFRADDIADGDDKTLRMPPAVIVTRALADRLFPDGAALGKPIYLTLAAGSPPSTIVGIVDRLQTAWPSMADGSWSYYATLVPARLANRRGYYLVRVQPGQLDALLRAIPAALRERDGRRVIPVHHGAVRFTDVRREAYQTDRGVAVVMGVVCASLLGITAAGIVGLTSFRVTQRRRQIGVRRALGATRRDILAYFLIENALVSGAGVLLGALLAVILGLWMATHYRLGQLPFAYIAGGALLLLALGQLATLAPARRAARVSPVEATRAV
jgi:putative ABC transport system permease protein